MKSAIALQQFKKCAILFMVGIGCISLACTIYIIDPLTMILKYNLQLTSNTILFSIWKEPPLDIYLKVYIFNITNPVEFLEGKEKLKVQEIGPYVYQEYLKNDNITYNDNGTASYVPKKTVMYVPEMSINDPMEDIVNVPNIPFVGISSALNDAGFMINYPIVKLANMLNTKPILNISVHDYLWGFEDSLVKLASGIVPNFINFQKFGLLDRMYDEGENIVTVLLKRNADMVEEKGRYLSIDKYNGSPGMAQWGYVETEGNETRKENTICNELQGAMEGHLFPSFLDKRTIFRIFRKAFCRPLPVVFRDEVWYNGLPGYFYNLTDNFADPPDGNPDNECYCRKRKTCLKKGLSDITPCYYNIPSAVSLPHFLQADPSLLEDVDGLKPDQEKHESYMILQQTVGVPLFCHTRIQTNLLTKRSRYNPKLAAFKDMAVPLFWFDMYLSTLPTYLTILLKLVLRILPIVQTILMYLLGIIGVTTSVLSLVFIVRNQQQRQKMTKNNDNPDLRIPLCNGQYTSINILPTIKRLSKADCLTNEMLQ